MWPPRCRLFEPDFQRITSTDPCGCQQQENWENKIKKRSKAVPSKSKAVSCSLKIYPREFCLQKEGLQITCVEGGVAFFRTIGIPQRKIPQP